MMKRRKKGINMKEEKKKKTAEAGPQIQEEELRETAAGEADQTGEAGDNASLENNEEAAEDPAELCKELEAKLAESEKQAADLKDRLLRTMAEFDNFRKRTAKEKEQERQSGQMDVIETILPLLDNFERAMTAMHDEDKDSAMAKGLTMIHEQFVEALKGIGLEEIEALGQPFDPNLHNAVQHVEDENTDENTVCEVYQKGYTMKGKVVRYSMVKVAN